MAKGEKGSSGSKNDHADLPRYGSTATPRKDPSRTRGNVANTTTPDEEGFSINSNFTISPMHRAINTSPEDAVKKTYFRD